jgi:hypothetical protein
MEKRKISARAAVADIRSGMGDTALRNKYGLSVDGLQSLLDKLIKDGFLDLGELRSRLSGFMGTVVVPETDIFSDKSEVKDQPVKSKSARRINVQEAARDIRSGMDDSALADKYRLTTRGLTSLYDKLLSLGVITQMDMDRRRLVMEDDTIDFREMSLDLSDALTQLGFNSTAIDNGDFKWDKKPAKRNPG